MSPSDRPPPEVLAIAVALAVAQAEQLARPATASPPTTDSQASPWPWSGERWERSGDFRWS